MARHQWDSFWSPPTNTTNTSNSSSHNNNNNNDSEQPDKSPGAGTASATPEQRPPLPLPPWFHPPLALPTPPKLELPDHADTDSVTSGPPTDYSETPLLLSPPLGPLGAPLDPRHIIHFLTRKVCQLFWRTFLPLSIQTILIRTDFLQWGKNGIPSFNISPPPSTPRGLLFSPNINPSPTLMFSFNFLSSFSVVVICNTFIYLCYLAYSLEINIFILFIYFYFIISLYGTHQSISPPQSRDFFYSPHIII